MAKRSRQSRQVKVHEVQRNGPYQMLFWLFLSIFNCEFIMTLQKKLLAILFNYHELIESIPTFKIISFRSNGRQYLYKAM